MHRHLCVHGIVTRAMLKSLSCVRWHSACTAAGRSQACLLDHRHALLPGTASLACCELDRTTGLCGGCWACLAPSPCQHAAGQQLSTSLTCCQACWLRAGRVQACTAPPVHGDRHALLSPSASPAGGCQALALPVCQPCCLLSGPCSPRLPALLLAVKPLFFPSASPAACCQALALPICQPCCWLSGPCSPRLPALLLAVRPWLSPSASPAAGCQALALPVCQPCCPNAQASFLYLQGWRLDPILLFGQLLVVGAAVTFAVEAIRLRSIVYGKVGATAGFERLPSVAYSNF